MQIKDLLINIVHINHTINRNFTQFKSIFHPSFIPTIGKFVLCNKSI